MARLSRINPLRLLAATVLGSIFLLFALPVYAEIYEISVTRKAANIYRVDGKNMVIQTRYCYEYVYGQSAIFKSNSYGGEIVFESGGGKCDVKAVYTDAKVPAGNYDVTVSREDDDMYEIFGKGIYVFTSSCLSLALGSEAILKVGPGGIGSIRFFSDGNNCMVEALYAKAKL